MRKLDIGKNNFKHSLSREPSIFEKLEMLIEPSFVPILESSLKHLNCRKAQNLSELMQTCLTCSLSEGSGARNPVWKVPLKDKNALSTNGNLSSPHVKHLQFIIGCILSLSLSNRISIQKHFQPRRKNNPFQTFIDVVWSVCSQKMQP